VNAGVDNLIVSIRAVTATESLYPLAATAHALLATTARPGGLLVAHLALLQAARRYDGQGLSDADFAAFRDVLDCLADVVTNPDPTTLDALALAWRALTRPTALQ